MVVIAFDRVSKLFPGVAALNEVSFEVQRGHCHALLGENGAGKSTLGKILAGIYQPDGGRILLDGQTARFRSPREATQAGVGIVHQELVFCPNLSVAENLCLHDLPRRGWRLDRRELRRRATVLLRTIGLDLDVVQPISRLSIAQEQMVQIAAAVGLGARVLVFDEPTSSLGRAETDQLFKLIRRLQSDGTTIIYISHRLDEIFALCQTVTVLRDGRHVFTRPVANVNHDDLVRGMVGRDVLAYSPPSSQHGGDVRLSVVGVSSAGKFHQVTFDVRSGEIVGLAGLVGAGRTELVEALFGLDPRVRGEVVVNGHGVKIHSPRQAMALGLALVPEDRKRHGLVLSMRVRENLSLSILDRFRRWLGRADRRGERQFADAQCQRFGVRTASIEAPAHALSGGNQQKIVLAKVLAREPSVLLIDEPTRGVDVRAKGEIHQLIGELAQRGAAVLLISSDLPELLALSSRILVLREGRIVSRLNRLEATPEAVLRAMAGIGSSSSHSEDAQDSE